MKNSFHQDYGRFLDILIVRLSFYINNRIDTDWLSLTDAGEVTLWGAQAFAAYSALRSPMISGPLFPGYMAYAMFASPLLEYGLIRYVSGVSMLEKQGDERYGTDPKWHEYKRRVPIFFPFGNKA